MPDKPGQGVNIRLKPLFTVLSRKEIHNTLLADP
jgi:hypothetical protein